MEQPVSLQAGTFLLSVLLGCGLGFVEIVLRAPRRLMPRLSWLMDLLLGIAITYGVLYALLVIDGGRLKFFDAAGILLGAWLFLKTLGRLLFPSICVCSLLRWATRCFMSMSIFLWRKKRLSINRALR